MEGYAILMILLAGFLFLYAGILAKTKDMKLIPRQHATKPKNKAQYAENVATVLALTALAPLASGVVARITDAALPSLTVLIGGMILMLWLGVRSIPKEE